MAAGLLCALLFIPVILINASRLIGRPGAWPLFIPMIALLALVIFIAAGVYRRNRAALTPAAWAYALAWTAVVQVWYGAFILATGRLPSKYASASVPRSSAGTYFLLAAAWWIIALALSRWSARSGADR